MRASAGYHRLHVTEISLQATIDDLFRFINAQKLLRYNLPESEISSESEGARAVQYLQVYLDALKFGKDLPDTELQPADDLAMLAGQAFVSAWRISGDSAQLYNAAALLEYASSRSKQSYLIRLLLIRIYRLLGTYGLYRDPPSLLGYFVDGQSDRRAFSGFGTL